MTERQIKNAEDLMRLHPRMTWDEACKRVSGPPCVGASPDGKIPKHLSASRREAEEAVCGKPSPGGDTQLFGCPLPDGSRRVITTDKDGNLISIRKEPASAQSAVDPLQGTPSSPPSWGVYEVKLHGSAEHGSDGYCELVRKVNSIPISTFVVLERAEEAKRELQDFFRRHVFNSVGQCYDRVRLHNATEKHSHYWSEGSCCWKVNPKYKAEGEE